MKPTTGTRTKMRRRQLLVSTAALGLLGACAAQTPAPITREDRRPIEGGIGGTGIVGLVTEFGSLIVNGVRVETTAATRYTTALGTTRASVLRLGESLTIEAEANDGRLFARRVHIAHPLVGEVQSVASNGQSLVVNGVTVLLEPQVRNLANRGDRLRVSGLWNGNTVVASRVAQDLSGADVIAGEAERVSGQTTIGGIPIVLPFFGASPQNGRYTTVVGRFVDGQFNATRLATDRFTGAAGRLRQLSVEGYLARTAAAPGFKVSGLGHSFARTLNLLPFQTERTLFEGGYSGTFDAEQALVLPSNYDARANLLARRLNQDASIGWRPIDS